MPPPVSPEVAVPQIVIGAAVEHLPADRQKVVPLDPLVVNPGRLSILLALHDAGLPAADGHPVGGGRGGTPADGADGVEFVDLRRRTRLTDGNLACHAKRLAAGGLIDVAKRFRAGKPVTTYLLTAAGRGALESHIRTLSAVLWPSDGGHVGGEVGGGVLDRRGGAAVPSSPFVRSADEPDEDDWVD